jgi:sugar O-acyltransferase (sialic acid O-acetyltransferase NeuD family)
LKNKVQEQAMKDFLLFGAGGHARKLIDIVSENDYKLRGFISTEAKGTDVQGFQVLANIDEYLREETFHHHFFHIAVGENSIRYEIFKKCHAHVDRLTTLISSGCILSPQVETGAGTFIARGVIIQPHASIGECSLIDTGAIIEHDVAVGDFVNVSPGAIICGGAAVGDGAIIGAGSTVIEKVKIGKNALIGAGAVVIRDIEPNSIAVGSPARVIKKRDFSDRYLK